MSMNNTDKLIVKALKSWLYWASKGAPKHKAFLVDDGLCFAVPAHVGQRFPNMHVKAYRRMRFIFDGAYPFGRDAYYKHRKNKHEDANRVAWVKFAVDFAERIGRLPDKYETKRYLDSRGL